MQTKLDSSKKSSFLNCFRFSKRSILVHHHQCPGLSSLTTDLNLSKRTKNKFCRMRDEFLSFKDDEDYSGSGDIYNSGYEHQDKYEGWAKYFGTAGDELTRNIINIFIAMICTLGLVGNGATIYVLLYSIKRNSFTTYILNLSIADFGVLTSLVIAIIFVTVLTLQKEFDLLFVFFLVFFEFFSFAYSASQFLLTAISLDRCVAVFFPLWHRYHRPPYLPTLVCGFIWILSFLLSAAHFILHWSWNFERSPFLYQLAVNGLLCTPLMIVSTVTLWIHMKWSKRQRNQRKLLTTILLVLLCFLLFSLPMNVFCVVDYFDSYNLLLMTIGMGCAALNSSINPLLYFLVGRKQRQKDQPRTSYKVALENVFRDEQGSPEAQETKTEDQL
ncbi:mas-related G-protein coupled receptor member H-like isoform X1 [Crotalus tigris]|uniref:mas-related G-protein coupled receptor member H-like isoform X1 n=1 Tax=Crotalus tigris TaxID=88082 RepID=UPI00192F37B3|nr:mas-related G-protein coupled receptor member H-like isoform X1 [Crotalus tigris]